MVLEVREERYSVIGKKGVSGNGVIVVRVVRELRGIMQ